MSISIKTVLGIVGISILVSLGTSFVLVQYVLYPNRMVQDTVSRSSDAIVPDTIQLSNEDTTQISESELNDESSIDLETFQPEIARSKSLADEYNAIQQELYGLYDEALQYDDGTANPPIPQDLAEKMKILETKRDAIAVELGAPSSP